jgi:hypothetical protein
MNRILNPGQLHWPGFFINCYLLFLESQNENFSLHFINNHAP